MIEAEALRELSRPLTSSAPPNAHDPPAPPDFLVAPQPAASSAELAVDGAPAPRDGAPAPQRELRLEMFHPMESGDLSAQGTHSKDKNWFESKMFATSGVNMTGLRRAQAAYGTVLDERCALRACLPAHVGWRAVACTSL